MRHTILIIVSYIIYVCIIYYISSNSGIKGEIFIDHFSSKVLDPKLLRATTSLSQLVSADRLLLGADEGASNKLAGEEAARVSVHRLIQLQRSEITSYLLMLCYINDYCLLACRYSI